MRGLTKNRGFLMVFGQKHTKKRKKSQIFSGEAGRRPAEPVLKWSNELKNEVDAKRTLTNRGRKYFGQI